MKKIKQERGITLIALVITIIVLLILAGVAISMLSGENGILTRASEAKEKTEEAQKEEEKNLASMELETYFITNNLKYKCAYGYVTGIEEKTKVSEMQSDLNAGGYELKAIDGTANFTAKEPNKENAEYIVTTDMQIQKDGKEIARTIIFGDLQNKGFIDPSDSTMITTWLQGGSDINKIAADVNHDGIVDWNDSQFIFYKTVNEKTINQNVYAMNPNNLILKDVNTIKNSYIEILSKNYTIKYTTWTYNDKEKSGDAITDIQDTTKIKDILDLLPEEAAIYRQSTKEIIKRDNETETVQTNDRIVVITSEVINEETGEITSYNTMRLNLYIAI